MLTSGWKKMRITPMPNSEFDSMCSISFTTVVANRSFGPTIRCSMSFGSIPGQVQTTLMTGLLISGNTSAGVRWMATTPKMMTRSDATTNVYGRRRARRTIHMRNDQRTSLARSPSLEIILRQLLVLEILIEPIDDVIDPLHAVHGLPVPREVVRLARKHDHDGRLVHGHERPKHRVPASPRGRATIRLALHEHERRGHVPDVGNG